MKTGVCFNCSHADNKSLFCQKCGQMLAVSAKFFMQELDIFEQWDFDKEKVEERYLKLMAILHPDKFIGKDDKLKQIALNNSSILNYVYQNIFVLSKRLAVYLKEMGSDLEAININSDLEFLSWTMDINEKIHNNSNSLTSEIKEEVEEMLRQLHQELELVFAKKDIKAIENIYAKINTLNNISNKKG